MIDEKLLSIVSMLWEGGRQEVDLSLRIGLVRDRQCAIRKQLMTTKGGSGLMIRAIIRLIKRFVMRLLNKHLHRTRNSSTSY